MWFEGMEKINPKYKVEENQNDTELNSQDKSDQAKEKD